MSLMGCQTINPLLFAKAMLTARHSSSLAHLWVKHNGGQSIKVSTLGCSDVDDFIDAIRKRLPNQLCYLDANQLKLHESVSDPALEPDVGISRISAAGLSAKAPLIVKTHAQIPLIVKTQPQIPLIVKTHDKLNTVMSSNIEKSAKLIILHDLYLVEAKEKEVEAKEKEVEAKEKEIQWQKERITELVQQKEQESLYKLHYQQLLTIRGLIELYEKNFGEKLLKKNLSRLEKWKAYLQSRDERFKPFKEAGFTVDQVGHHVDTIFKSHSADIHSVKAVEGLILKAKGNLTDDQMKIVKIIVGVSPWKDVISIE